MAELDVGKHCEIKSCNQKDFLPFVCDACSGVFCLEHRSRDCHGCPEVPVRRAVSASGSPVSYPCSFQDCRARELVPVICPPCQKHFCFAHRHQDDHQCVRLEVRQPRMSATHDLVQRIVESKKDVAVSKGRRGARSSATAAKVALMKLKLHASGDKGLPLTERRYFQVYLPREAPVPSLPMFFCSSWSAGKVVDVAASLAGLRNNNNILTAKKLRLCHPESGLALGMDATLQSLLTCTDSPLHNGGNLILEYLDNEIPGLEDVSAYMPS